MRRIHISVSKNQSIALLVVALLLCALQAFVWWRVVHGTRYETEVQNKVQKQPPTYIPGLLGLGLLAADAGLIIWKGEPEPEPAANESLR
jgi:hypothetical protein